MTQLINYLEIEFIQNNLPERMSVLNNPTEDGLEELKKDIMRVLRKRGFCFGDDTELKVKYNNRHGIKELGITYKSIR